MSLNRSRSLAFRAQNHCCYYCGYPIWESNPREFCAVYGLSTPQARRFQCSAEHRVARRDGGGNGPENIVAACVFCNRTRHRSKAPLSSTEFARHVRRRVAQGKWHPPEFRCLLVRRAAGQRDGLAVRESRRDQKHLRH
jgi:hypothetical protein